jgi:hypothetical protein
MNFVIDRCPIRVEGAAILAMRFIATFLLAVISLGAVVENTAIAQKEKSKDELISWDRNISGIVRKYCHRCHNDTDSNGNINLARDKDVRNLLDHREIWEKVRLVVESGEMPPSDEKQLTDDEVSYLKTFLANTLDNVDCSQASDPGRPVLRRLNKTEYNLCVEDLVGLSLDIADHFPPDASSYGFDNIAESLSISPVHIEQYHDAAHTIVASVAEVRESDPQKYATVFGKFVQQESPTLLEIDTWMKAIASKAFRRPVEEQYAAKLLQIYEKARARGSSAEQSQRYVLQAILISPRFLTRVEDYRPGKTEAYAIDDYELASRTSFFLWSRGPDQMLLDLAKDNQLSEPKVLSQQVDRMIKDERAVALASNFFGQWLSIREKDLKYPDTEVFRDFDWHLHWAIGQESEMFLREIVSGNKSILELIDSDYTYVNARLAKHYGLEGIDGESVRRIELKDRRRGGLITSAAMLMSQSDPNRTNVPRRGNYLASRILGTPPPPPPPDVPALEPEKEGNEKKPLRQVLEQHRKDPTCANCHAKMDPLGFALENYDATGKWRTQDAGFEIDASGELIGGRRFNGPEELKDVLLDQKDAFAKTLLRNLVIYAFGRGLQGSDECLVRSVLTQTQSDGYRFGDMVKEIVLSEPFRMRKNPSD